MYSYIHIYIHTYIQDRSISAAHSEPIMPVERKARVPELDDITNQFDADAAKHTAALKPKAETKAKVCVCVYACVYVCNEFDANPRNIRLRSSQRLRLRPRYVCVCMCVCVGYQARG